MQTIGGKCYIPCHVRLCSMYHTFLSLFRFIEHVTNFVCLSRPCVVTTCVFSAAGGKTPDLSSERRTFADVMTENKLKAQQVLCHSYYSTLICLHSARLKQIDQFHQLLSPILIVPKSTAVFRKPCLSR